MKANNFNFNGNRATYSLIRERAMSQAFEKEAVIINKEAIVIARATAKQKAGCSVRFAQKEILSKSSLAFDCLSCCLFETFVTSSS